jgi:hypothetical protein
MNNEQLLHEMAVAEIRKLLTQKQFEGLKLVENEAKTGVSFFQGKDRLCKVIKSKRGLAIEINVLLPEEMQGIAGLTHISKTEAHQKHLGTMRHIYRGTDMKEVRKIMLNAIKIFQANMKQKEAEKENPVIKETKEETPAV